MNNQTYELIVDQVFTLLAPYGFTRVEVEKQLIQLMEICILRLEDKLIKEASITPQNFTLSSWEKFLKECAERNPELHNLIAQEYNSLLEKYLEEVTGARA